MQFDVIFSDQVEKDLIKIIDYLVDNWGTNSAAKFEKRAKQVFISISKMPCIGTKHINRKKVFRELPITKQNTLIYTIEGEKVFLAKIFDNRQHPDKKYNF
ncbi:MAG: type II toxin-antitoxin system RelE/ParE family toxin [Candidatus Symbiothrix sp.]|jgi:plasmid stabilization system protein ParE|nr:type II toxin-antitoxin system RelE/ParE family toxin [Candidatus Symbiothrix sp.]